LKDELEGDLFLIGCGELARHLIAGGLVDDLRFWLHPSVWGEGSRPYQGEKVRMRLVDTTSYDSGVTLLRYEPVAGQAR
jgi:dihydrofolate reductase